MLFMTPQTLYSSENKEDMGTYLQPHGNIIFSPFLEIGDLEDNVPITHRIPTTNFIEKNYGNKKNKRA